MIMLKYKLVQVKERTPSWTIDNKKGVIEKVIITNCCRFQEDDFVSAEEAVAFRDLLEFPLDYIVIAYW